MIKKLTLTLALLLAISPISAVAQATDEDAVKNLMELTRRNITKARMTDGNFVPAETAEQLKKPVIPYETGKRVIRIASTSATAQWCNVEWRTSFFHPFIKGEIDKKVWTEKQIAYIGLLHGMTMSAIIKGTETMKKCNESDKEKVSEKIAAKNFK